MLALLAVGYVVEDADDAPARTVLARRELAAQPQPSCRAVRPQIAEVGLEAHLAARHCLRTLFLDTLALARCIARAQFLHRRAGIRREAAYPVEFRRVLQCAGRQVEVPDRHLGRVHGQTQRRLTLGERVVGELFIGDVLQGPDVPDGSLTTVDLLENRLAIRLDPAHRPVACPPDAVTEFLLLPDGRVQRAAGHRGGTREVLRVGHVAHLLKRHRPIGWKPADPLRQFRIDDGTGPEIPVPDADAGGLERYSYRRRKVDLIGIPAVGYQAVHCSPASGASESACGRLGRRGAFCWPIGQAHHSISPDARQSVLAGLMIFGEIRPSGTHRSSSPVNQRLWSSNTA